MPWGPLQRLAEPIPDPPWRRVSALVAERLGLHFPPHRLADLQRGLASAAMDLGLPDATACAHWLLASPPTAADLDLLASHLTVGETYFFRDRPAFESLAARVLPEVIRARRGRDQRLRLWSAACCSGEEAYSLAILLRQILPDVANWHVTVLGTDVNPRFLRKAVAGVYGEWSFRDAPAGFKERYFHRTGSGYAVRDEVRRMVTFEHLNLVSDAYPAVATNTNAMDVILCRNVLMYFSPEQARKTVANLHRSLRDGGWLVVAPSEISQDLLSQFEARTLAGVILHQKDGGQRPAADEPYSWTSHDTSAASSDPVPAQSAPAMRVEAAPPSSPPRPRARHDLAVSLYAEGRYAEVVETLVSASADGTPDAATLSLLARALANLGRLADALAWCDRWVAAYKLDAAGHHMRAMILLEDGQHDEARRALERTLYLDPNLVLAHVSLGMLAQSRGGRAAAARHFGNALRLLHRLDPGDVLPESEGLTAGRLAETVSLMIAGDHTP